MIKFRFLIIFLLILIQSCNTSKEGSMGFVNVKKTKKNNINQSLNSVKKTKVKKENKGLTFRSRKKNNKDQLPPDQTKLTKVKVNSKNSFKNSIKKTAQVLGLKKLESKTDCPKGPPLVKEGDKNVHPKLSKTKAFISTSTKTLNFNLVRYENRILEIPAFKQFKNNMTDFTADGEDLFNKSIILKIKKFLGDNTNGKGVTLSIIGSASQVPTSFDPSLPNKNINLDGSSITGQTSIENNKKLAMARANELAKKIKVYFKEIKIITPYLEDIKLGPTKWTAKTQQRLQFAIDKKSDKMKNDVYAPFQKDQWVKVESNQKLTKVIKSSDLRMYMMSTSPTINFKEDEKVTEVKSIMVISKKTFENINGYHKFETVDERDEFLNKLGLNIYRITVEDKNRWFMLGSDNEVNALQIEDHPERVYQLYKLGVIDSKDELILEKKIIEETKATNIDETK